MTTRTPANARAIRSVYALLALVATAGLGLLLVVVGVFRADAESRSDLEDFYLRSLIIETEMAADADRAHDVIDHGVGADGELEAALDSLAGRVDELRVLQDEFGEPRFESTLARLETQADRLQPGTVEEAQARVGAARGAAEELSELDLGAHRGREDEEQVHDESHGREPSLFSVRLPCKSCAWV